MECPSCRPLDKFMLWIDAVGGYWVCLGDVVTVGQPTGADCADVPIMGDISSRHARIRRDGEGYLIESIRGTRVDGRAVAGAAPLEHGCTIELAERVRLAFRRPHALSATARLDFASAHRTQPTADAVLLMADSCVLGPGADCHVVCRNWTREVMLYRHGPALYCRAPGPLEIDGRLCQGHGQVTLASRVTGDGFSFSLEAIR
jgi:hypothetical protein